MAGLTHLTRWVHLAHLAHLAHVAHVFHLCHRRCTWNDGRSDVRRKFWGIGIYNNVLSFLAVSAILRHLRLVMDEPAGVTSRAMSLRKELTWHCLPLLGVILGGIIPSTSLSLSSFITQRCFNHL